MLGRITSVVSLAQTVAIPQLSNVSVFFSQLLDYTQLILTLVISDDQNFSTNDLQSCIVLTPELESVAAGCEGLHAKQK